MADIKRSLKAFNEWLNNETDDMSDPEYCEFLEEIEDNVSASRRAKEEEMEDGEDDDEDEA